VSSGRRAGLRFDATFGVTTEALIFLGELDPEAIGPSLEHATHYEPTPLGDAERLLDALPIPAEGTVFVDIGSGLGRMVLLAARRPFRQVIGLEISPALHELARENLAAARDPERRCRDVRLVRGDAAAYRWPRGNLALYLYNPFRAEVLAAVLDAVLADRTRDIALIYHTPLEAATIAARPEFEPVADLGIARVYLARRAPQLPR
jgi:SAM-dependent methyltransferase